MREYNLKDGQLVLNDKAEVQQPGDYEVQVNSAYPSPLRPNGSSTGHVCAAVRRSLGLIP
jgi:hypothetical protein